MKGELPLGWTADALGDCVDVLDHMRVPVNGEERSKRLGSVPYYGATGRVGWIDKHLFDEELVLIGEDGAPFLDKTRPIAYIIRGKAWVNNHAHVLRAKAHVATNRFIKYALDVHDFHGYVNGTTRLKLTKGSLVGIPVRHPPLPDQQRIVAKVESLLADVNAARDRLAKVPAILKRFRQSVLAAACSGRMTEDWRRERNAEEWSSAPLGECNAEIRIGPFGSILHRSDYIKGGVPLVNPTHMVDGKIVVDPEIGVSEKKARELSAYRLHGGDIVLGRRGEMGRAAVVAGEAVGYLCGTGSLIIRTDPARFDPSFLCLVLRSPGTVATLQEESVGSTMTNLNQGILESLEVPCPQIEEQRCVVQRVSASFNMADAIAGSVSAGSFRTAAVIQAILAKAFKGELVPTDAALKAGPNT